ncbi:glycoside hydrolase family 13 protein [Pseudalkalibacillus caeni]|uniref:oligo-1,6-glucosidase n=1 Tax=Exobacillus caeni TaxID=2574798 RepID=A0A5R9F6W8_9BACL|nr:alpha-glucosidase [Pseudalkalibacillus caeni]TLS38086.1 alpha-glucosidase [Pseudalkalibacillus caeni]
MSKQWWKESVVYQVYPRSFNDSNGDGIGDIKGITEKLDYLQELGIDVVWLSPVYQSPNDDNGYDISDYRDIMSEFGTMEEWEEMLDGMHVRGIKLLMDLVVNHSSDEHTWFLESRKSKDNEYRDYYIWRPGKDGKAPNNWASFFSGSAWQNDEETGEYYLHLFSKKQPDLNWENPKVRSEIHDVVRFWIDKGVDGFRLDAIDVISKTEGLPDAKVVNDDQYQWGGEYFFNGPRMMEFLKELDDEVFSKHDLMTVAETSSADIDRGIALTNEQDGVVNMLFHFEHMDLTSGPGGKWDQKDWELADLKRVMTKWQNDLEGKGWNSLYMENHDQPRSVSVFGNDKEYRVKSAKMLATWLHMMQGTPYIYQGQELGMTNVRFGSIEDYRDVEIHNMYKEQVLEKEVDPVTVMEKIYKKGRDNARTPMQWDASENAGFTTGDPWIKVNPNYKEINAEEALKDPASIFYHYKKLIELRKKHDVIVYGSYKLILEDHSEIYAYTRTLNDETLLVISNFSDKTPLFELPEDIGFSSKELLISNYEVGEEDIKGFKLKPYESRVYRLT